MHVQCMRNVNVAKSGFSFYGHILFFEIRYQRAKLVGINEFSWFIMSGDKSVNEQSQACRVVRSVFGNLFEKKYSELVFCCQFSGDWRWHQIETGSCSRAVLSGIRNILKLYIYVAIGCGSNLSAAQMPKAEKQIDIYRKCCQPNEQRYLATNYKKCFR